MTKSIEDLFVYLVFATDFLLLFFLLYNLNKCKKEKILLAIFFYCLIDILVNYITEIYSGLFVYYSYGFFTALEYLIFAYILALNITNRIIQKIIFFVSILFMIFLIGYYSTTKPRSIDSTPIGIETILIIIYTFYYLYEQMNDTKNLFIYSKFQFWIVVGIMIYLAGAFFIYIFANQVDRTTLDNFWFLTMAFYVIKNIFFGIGIYFFLKQFKTYLKTSNKLSLLN